VPRGRDIAGSAVRLGGRAAARLAALALGLALGAGCGGGVVPPPAPAPRLPPDLTPVPIAAAPPAREPRGPCASGPVRGRFRAHVELFAHRRAIVIPAGIGLRAPVVGAAGRVEAARCRAALRTLEPVGVVDFDRGDLRLRDLFAVWGEPLGRDRMLSYRGPVAVFVAGQPAAGLDVPLGDGAQIVVELGGYVPPHRSFLFPPRG
jgi:hypothetical protein